MQVPKSSWERVIDVSQFNNGGHPINWDTVVPRLKSLGYSRVLMRASYGSGYQDPQFAHNWSELGKLGFSRGAYHAAVPGIKGNVDANAQQQAAYFLLVVGRQGGIQGSDWSALDLEQTGGLTPQQLSLWASHWLASVDAAVKNPKASVIFYSYPSFVKTHMSLYDALSERPLWIADYPGGADLPQTAPPSVGNWTAYFGWQYTDQLVIPDISGYVDGSVFAVVPTETSTVGDSHKSGKKTVKKVVKKSGTKVGKKISGVLKSRC